MDKQEFLDGLSELSSGLNNYIKTRDQFTADMAITLMSYANKMIPNLEKDQPALVDLREEAETLSMMSFEYFQSSFDSKDNDPLCDSCKKFLPRLTTLEEGEAELKKFLESLPKQYRDEEAANVFWEGYHEENEIAREKKELHDLVKSVLVKHFEEDIIEFSKAGLYHLENTSWMMVGNDFMDKVYGYIERE